MSENSDLLVADKCCTINALQQLCATMQIGCARGSIGDQDAAAKSAALKAASCDLIFREKASGGRWDRPEPATNRFVRFLGGQASASKPQLEQGEQAPAHRVD